MRQVIQDTRTGAVELIEVPAPSSQPGRLLVQTRLSLVSAGTERSIVAAGNQSLVSKAIRNPDKVLKVLRHAVQEGPATAASVVKDAVEQLQPLGYCNVGHVIDVGERVRGFTIGDRVASNGPHAEVVSVPQHLAAKIPTGVDDSTATLTVQAAIALHGMRMAAPSLGEVFVVSGVGLIGLLAVQLLKSAGCRVLALDYNHSRLDLASSMGAVTANLASDDPLAIVNQMTEGRGADGVLIATVTSSEEPLTTAAVLSRKRGRIVLTGVATPHFERQALYEKELSFQVSCSYGPGRYDPEYEESGHDYPAAYVRWTEQRNFGAVLQLMDEGNLSSDGLIGAPAALEDVSEVYRHLDAPDAPLGVQFEYPNALPTGHVRTVATPAASLSVKASASAGEVGVCLLGAGGFASAVLAPALRQTGARLHVVASRSALPATRLSRKFGFERVSTDIDAALSDPNVDAVVIATRHDSHGALTLKALKAGKHVYVEKPLCLDRADLARIENCLLEASPIDGHPVLMVGFNRRFSPLIMKLKSLIEGRQSPVSMVMTVYTEPMPANHWNRDLDIGGGRLLSEACHFVDLLVDIAGTTPVSIQGVRLAPQGDRLSDNGSITMQFPDGSIGTILYFESGQPSLPKEKLEVHSEGRVLMLDDFRTLTGFGWPGFGRMKLRKRDKGNRSAMAEFIGALREGRKPLVTAESYITSMRTTFAVMDALNKTSGADQ